MPEIDYLQLHKDKKEDRQALNQRRNSDYELVTSYEYTMKDADDQKIKGVIHTTMNRLKVFRAYVLASLDKADERIVVESDDEAFDTSVVEDIIQRAFRSADLKLFKKGLFGLDPFFDEQSCMTGELASRVIFQEMAGVEGQTYLDTDIAPWDARYITYEMGAEGLDWGGYELKKTKGVIASEAWAIEKNFTITAKDAMVIDLWTPEENIVYVEEKQVYTQPNIYGFVPICVQRVPIGTLLVGEGGEEHQMESIFFLVRDLINEYNRCLSILQTLNLLAIKPALTEVTTGEAHEYEDLASPGSSTPVSAPNAVQIVPYGEARRAMALALQEINRALDDGTLSRIMLGDLPGEMSAVALVQIEKGQGQVYMPRLGARGLEKMQIAQMGIKQIQTLGITSFELGVPGHRKVFNLSDLDGEYEINFTYTNRDPETDFARLSMATQYKVSELMDDLTIMERVMKSDDPKGDLRKVHRQRARQMSPALQMYDTLMAMAEDYENGDESAAVEIEILEAELGVTIDQILSGNLPQAQPQEKIPQEGFLPTTTGERSSAQKATDLQATPGETEEGE